MASSSNHWIFLGLALFAIAICHAAEGPPSLVAAPDETTFCEPSNTVDGEDNSGNCTELGTESSSETEGEYDTLTEVIWEKIALDTNREQMLFHMLQAWKSLYEEYGAKAVQAWYQVAKSEIYNLDDFLGIEEEDDTEEIELDKEKETALLELLEKWESLYESERESALFKWYGSTRFSIFGLPNLSDLIDETPAADPEDLWYVNEKIDSRHGLVADMYDYLGCESVTKRRVEAYNHPSTWELIRRVYIAIVGEENSALSAVEGTGFFVDVKFDYVEGQSRGYAESKGRGVIAMEDIPEGTLIWNEDYCVTMNSAEQYRKFILTLPPRIACDYFLWSYSILRDQLDPSTAAIGFDMDGSGMMNEGEGDEINMVYDVTSDGHYGLVATRDIAKGEELVMSYDFVGAFYKQDALGLKKYDKPPGPTID